MRRAGRDRLSVSARPIRSSNDVAERLRAAGCIAADDEAADLVAAAPNGETLDAWVRRRERGEPLAWVIGTARFCGRAILIHPGVYVPRPQTEELARRASALLPPDGLAADLCTGSGAIALHLAAEAPQVTVVGVDLDVAAVACARRNDVLAVLGDLGSPLRATEFDLVTAVAPYVPRRDLRLLPADVRRYEPRFAHDGGEDGLDVVRRITVDAARLLRSGGYLLIELGGDQDVALRATLADRGFDPAESWYDDQGDLRGIAAQKAA